MNGINSVNEKINIEKGANVTLNIIIDCELRCDILEVEGIKQSVGN